MKHLLNDMSEKEKNSIREQHTGGKQIINEKFSILVNSKLGDAKPLVSEQANAAYKVGQVFKAKRSTDNQIYTIKVVQIINDGTHIVGAITGPGQYQGKPLNGNSLELNVNTPGIVAGNMELGDFTIQK